LFQQHNDAVQKAHEFSTSNEAFRKLKTETEAQQKMFEVIPETQKEDISDDNGVRSKSLPEIQGENGEEAAVYDNSRMFTISQFH
jgi:hypothetical protein